MYVGRVTQPLFTSKKHVPMSTAIETKTTINPILFISLKMIFSEDFSLSKNLLSTFDIINLATSSAAVSTNAMPKRT